MMNCWCSFSVHAIQMNEKVTSIFERAINVFSRKDDVSGDRYETYFNLNPLIISNLCLLKSVVLSTILTYTSFYALLISD